VLIALEKSYLSYMGSNGDTLYIKIVVLDEIYNVLVLSFFNLRSLRCSEKKTNQVLAVY